MDLFHGTKSFFRLLALTSLCISLSGCDLGESEVTPRGHSPKTTSPGGKKNQEVDGIFILRFVRFETQVSQFVNGLDDHYYLLISPSSTSFSSTLMKSADGELWQSLSLPARSEIGSARSVAVNSEGHIYVVGSEKGGVYRSIDSGDSFEALGLGQAETPIFDKLLVAEDDSVIAANLSEFYVIPASKDDFVRGRWPAGFPNDTLMVFTAHNQIFTRVLNSTNQGIAASRDKGTSFNLRESAIAPHFMAVDSAGVLFAVDSKGVLVKSTDKGKKFVSVGVVAADLKVVDFAIDANNWLFVLTPQTLYYSSNAGKNFKSIPANLGLNLEDDEFSDFKKMLILKNRRVLISTGSKVFISE